MKILHLSDGTLPDIRIERAAITATSRNHDVVFVGGRPIQSQIFNVFKRIHHFPWNRYSKLGIPMASKNIQKQLSQILREEEPDLIHAHDLFAGKLALDSGYPFVYDDHEYWGFRIKFKGTQIMKPRREPHRRLVYRFAIHNWRIWESQIIRKVPTITVSEEVAKIYRKIQPETYVIPNVPTNNEIKMIPKNKNINEEFRIAYISARSGLPFKDRRDASALSLWLNHPMNAKLVFVGFEIIKAKNVENHGFVSHVEMLQIIADCDIALMGSKIAFPHLSIKNKFALFLHTGLKTIIPNSQIVMARFCRLHNVGWVWRSSKDLQAIIQKLAQKYYYDPTSFNDEKKYVRGIAKKHLLWENYENRLFQVYNAAL